MALAKKLLHVLDDSDEPLAKRIKIAENAFNSPDLPLQHKEAILLKWSLKHNNVDGVELVNSWLQSSHFKEFNRNDISNEDVQAIMQLVLDNLGKNKNEDNIIRNKCLDSAISLLEIRIFQQYFKQSLEEYCSFLATIIKNISDTEQFLKFLKKEYAFSKGIIAEEEFYVHFLNICLPVLTEATIQFASDDKLFTEISKVVQRCIFYRNFKNFEGFINKFFDQEATTEKYPVPKAVFKYISNAYENNLIESKALYRLLFDAFCAAYDKFDVVYKCFILLNVIIGYDVKELYGLKKVSKLSLPSTTITKSNEIFLELLSVLCKHSDSNDFKVNEVTITDLLQKMLVTFMGLTNANSNIYQIFLRVITFNPLIIESIIKPIIVFSMLAENSNHKNDYIQFLTAVFEVFSKLHRTQNFIAKLVPTIKAALEGEQFVKSEINFAGTLDVSKNQDVDFKIENILPQEVLEYFKQCVANLASWQVMNLFKTLLFHLNAAVEELQNNNTQEQSYVTYMEILSSLTCSVLSSVRMAEHTITQTVVEKFVKSMEEMKTVLKHFGKALLSREHNQILVRAFLNISYNWSEMHMVLNYYSPMEESKDAENVTYNIHSYLSVKQWSLIYERITNFGEKPCKELMQKIFIQKLRAKTIFEKDIEDLSLDVAQNFSNTVEESWKNIMLDKFAIKNLLGHIEPQFIVFIAENVLNNFDDLDKQQRQNIMESQLLLNALNYVVLTRINKIIKKKNAQSLSNKVFSVITSDFFILNDDDALLKSAENAYNSSSVSDIKINETKLTQNIDYLKMFPIIYSSENMQKFYLLYFFALHKDIGSSSNNLKTSIESIIIGLLQHVKFSLLTIFDAEKLCFQIISSFDRYESTFQQITDGSIRNMALYEGCITCLVKNMNTPEYLKCATIYLNCYYKMKKLKQTPEVKALVNEQKTQICDKMEKVVLKKGPLKSHLIGAYAHVFKNSPTTSEEKDREFANFALQDYSADAVQGALLLFSTILNNKSRAKYVDDEFLLKVWNWSKQLNVSAEYHEQYSQLIVLIFSLISNEKFSQVTKDLLEITLINVKTNDEKLIRQVKIWESIVSCSFNPVKVKLWQETLEVLLQDLTKIFQNNDESSNTCILKFFETVIHTNQLHLTPPMIDIFLLTPSLILRQNAPQFVRTYTQSISILESLLKCRKPLVVDRLPVYLQQYGLLLDGLCAVSDADKNGDAQLLSDCAHSFEKLTRQLVECKKDMGRMAMYLVADILGKYEKVTLHVNVKLHLNNCVYSLISLCDQHAVSFLMRVLSSASTEMFKILYDNYKKYYRFTGKV
ncbi:unnamed protein product [Brassicogethes aeneus]|uniref:Nucleolar 27S pre-rRNA processing Urb2/Npa2 C-terminal domain-containing protein n=1 Tax=Brassicogethes aeneus TaxID=1431903 RepID=A0A9P0FCD4_BRAAE|nr:unnamed protein product [Brassicogethes aeneus]